MTARQTTIIRKGRVGREIAKLRELRTRHSDCRRMAVNLCNATIKLLSTRLSSKAAQTPIADKRRRLCTAMNDLRQAHQGPARQPFAVLLSKAGTALAHIH